MAAEKPSGQRTRRDNVLGIDRQAVRHPRSVLKVGDDGVDFNQISRRQQLFFERNQFFVAVHKAIPVNSCQIINLLFGRIEGKKHIPWVRV